MVKASPQKKKENASKKGSLAKDMKTKNNTQKGSFKGKRSPDDIVEFYGRSITVAEMQKMDSIINKFKRWANTSDIQKFVKEFPAFVTEGTLELNRTKIWHCVICKKHGHPREACPKTWKDGKWLDFCYVCGKPGFPHPLCKKKDVCYLCSKEDHRAMECPDKKLYNRTDDTPRNPKKKVQAKKGKKPLQEKNNKKPLSPKKKKGPKSKA